MSQYNHPIQASIENHKIFTLKAGDLRSHPLDPVRDATRVTIAQCRQMASAMQAAIAPPPHKPAIFPNPHKHHPPTGTNSAATTADPIGRKTSLSFQGWHEAREPENSGQISLKERLYRYTVG